MTTYSSEFAFDGAELVEWHSRHYGPTCTVCKVRFCGFTGRTVCPGCTPWEEAMPRDTAVVLEEPAMSPRMAIAVSCFSRWSAHRDAGHQLRASLWLAIAEAVAP